MLEQFLAENRLIIAPMAGVSDAVFRSLCVRYGADFGYTEMVSAKGLHYGNENTHDMLALAENERFVAVQLFGSEPATMAGEAARVEDELGDRLAFIDINMGCPVRKVIKKGEGSALMGKPDLAAEIVGEIARAIEHPVTVKMRRGIREGEELAPEFAKRMEDAGASAVAVHGRYAQQFYKGASDWDCIRRVKENVSIPVIGSGDVVDGESALRFFEQTGCDAVMIGRASQGNPWVFSEIRAALAEEAFQAPSLTEKAKLAKEHARLLQERYGTNLSRMRQHAMAYLKGAPRAAYYRGLICTCATYEDFEELFDEVIEHAARSV